MGSGLKGAGKHHFGGLDWAVGGGGTFGNPSVSQNREEKHVEGQGWPAVEIQKPSTCSVRALSEAFSHVIE